MNNKWKTTFMKIAQEIATHSTCTRLQVGCVIVKDKRVVSMGYNGTPKGHCHCNENFEKGVYTDEAHRIFSDKNELHAEQNAIAFAAKGGISINNNIMFVTMSPCNSCSKLIIASGIREVYYLEEYDRSIDGLRLMKKSKIKLENFKI